MGRPNENKIPSIAAKEVLKVISPKVLTFKILVKIGVKTTGPNP